MKNVFFVMGMVGLWAGCDVDQINVGDILEDAIFVTNVDCGHGDPCDVDVDTDSDIIVSSDSAVDCAYECLDACFSIGGEVMPGECPDPAQKCCNLEMVPETDSYVTTCEYACTEHCYSIGGTPMPGECDGDLRCCDLSGAIDTETEEAETDEDCAYECLTHCRSIGGTPMPGECDEGLQCCSLEDDDNTGCVRRRR